MLKIKDLHRTILVAKPVIPPPTRVCESKTGVRLYCANRTSGLKEIRWNKLEYPGIPWKFSFPPDPALAPRTTIAFPEKFFYPELSRNKPK
jgi:hypothetical protein